MDKVEEDCNGIVIVVFEALIVSPTVFQSSFFVVSNVVTFFS